MRGMGQSAPIVTRWWTVPANFENPVNLLVEDEEVEQIFSQDDKYLWCIKEHSNTLIQLERYCVACSYTHIIITGPVRAQRWLMYMMSCLRIDDPDLQAEGLEMLQHVRSEPLTKEDIRKIEASTRPLPKAVSTSGTISLEGLVASPFQVVRCFWVHGISSYPK